ncbi:MAG: calcium:proton antiporter [Rhodopila sp.]
MASPAHDSVPTWTWVLPTLAGLLLVLKLTGIAPQEWVSVQILAGLLLAGSVFAAVHHAEILALKLGEPFGSILLAVAVTVIEVGLIIAIYLSGTPGSETVARDTVFSAVMIVLNGIVGLCLVLGAGRHMVQVFQLQGASAALNVLAPLAILSMVLPNFTFAIQGPYYSTFQLEFVGAGALVLYALFVFVQTVRHRDYFLDALPDGEVVDGHGKRPPAAVTAVSAVFLPIALASVVFLAKILSHPLEDAVSAAGLPRAVVGVVIALILMLPEGLASVRAAMANRLQNALNLALGSAIASIGLTIPTVAAVSIIWGPRQLALGLNEGNMVLLLLSLFMAGQTLSTGRTTVLQGGVHLVVFAMFLMIAASP